MSPTPLRNVRVPDDLWHAALATTQRRGETVTDVITRALTRYVARHAVPDTPDTMLDMTQRDV